MRSFLRKRAVGGFLVPMFLILSWSIEARGDRGVGGPNIPDTICAWQPIIPSAVVFNLGNLIEQFYVFCEIDSTDETIYTDSTWLLLGPGQMSMIAFREWQPDGPGNTYTVTVYLSPPDTNPSNDTVSAITTTIDCPGIEEENLSSLRQDVLLLLQNYPNPFSASTQIEYRLPNASDVKIVVYDLSGRLVSTLVDENKNAGSYTIVWDGRDNSGKKLASGIYFYHLRAGEHTVTKAMHLLR